MNIHVPPDLFDVYQGCRVLTHSHIKASTWLADFGLSHFQAFLGGLVIRGWHAIEYNQSLAPRPCLFKKNPNKPPVRFQKRPFGGNLMENLMETNKWGGGLLGEGILIAKRDKGPLTMECEDGLH